MSESIAERAAPTAEQVEAVTRETDSLKRAMGRSRSIRLLLTVAALAFVVTFGLLFYRQASRLQSEAYLNALLDTATRRLEDRSDDYMREVQLLVNTSSPVITQAFYSKAKEDLPAYLSGLQTEREALIANLRQIASDRLNDHHANVLRRYEGILREEFPDFNDEQYGRMINNLEVALRRITDRYYVDELTQQLNGLYDSWDQFPMAEEPAPGEAPLEDVFVGELIDLLQKKLTELDRAQLASASAGSASFGSVATKPINVETPEEPASDIPPPDASATPSDSATDPEPTPDTPSSNETPTAETP